MAGGQAAANMANAKVNRVERLKWRIVEAPQEVCVQRARYLTESMERHWHEDPLIRMSLALEHILKNIDVVIREDEFVVGCRTSKLKGAPLFRKTNPAG